MATVTNRGQEIAAGVPSARQTIASRTTSPHDITVREQRRRRHDPPMSRTRDVTALFPIRSTRLSRDCAT
jgi:hypothetical protein